MVIFIFKLLLLFTAVFKLCIEMYTQRDCNKN